MANEKCVICGGDTGIPRNTPLKARERYVRGGGQLCRRCFYETYIKPDPEEALRPSNEEMEVLLAMLQQP